MAYQRLSKYRISFHLFKLSEPWKFQMCSFCVNTDEKHSSKQAIFSLISNWMKKWVIFDTMAYQRLSEYQIIFLLFKVSEPWKFQMSPFCISTDETQFKKAIFLSFQTEWKNESYLTQWHTKGFQNIKLVSLYSKSMSCENSKCLHFASVQMKNIVQNRPFFSHSKQNEKWVIFDTMAYQLLLKYHISFLLSKVSKPWKFQISSFCVSTSETDSPKQAIFFSHSKRMKKWVIFDTMGYQRFPEYQTGLPLFKVNELRNSKCHHFASVQVKQMVWPVLHHVFHLYWCKMKTFGIFTAHWLWVNANKFDILEASGMPLCQIWLIFSFCLEWKKKWPVLNCFLSELMQNKDIWNFHGSLSLSKWKLIWYSGSL